MKECKYCGMPLDEEAAEKICAYCQNDDGREMINFEQEETEELIEEY